MMFNGRARYKKRGDPKGYGIAWILLASLYCGHAASYRFQNNVTLTKNTEGEYVIDVTEYNSDHSQDDDRSNAVYIPVKTDDDSTSSDNDERQWPEHHDEPTTIVVDGTRYGISIPIDDTVSKTKQQLDSKYIAGKVTEKCNEAVANGIPVNAQWISAIIRYEFESMVKARGTKRLPKERVEKFGKPTQSFFMVDAADVDPSKVINLEDDKPPTPRDKSNGKGLLGLLFSTGEQIYEAGASMRSNTNKYVEDMQKTHPEFSRPIFKAFLIALALGTITALQYGPLLGAVAAMFGFSGLDPQNINMFSTFLAVGAIYLYKRMPQLAILCIGGFALHYTDNAVVKIDSVRVHAEYKPLVQCPDAKKLEDVIHTNKGSKCFGSPGEALAKGATNMYQACRNWAGWQRHQRELMKEHDYYHCVNAEDGRWAPEWCISSTITRCIHLRVKDDVSQFTVASRSVLSTFITIEGKEIKTPAVYKGVTIDLDASRDYPDVLIVRDSKAYLDERLRSAHYASAHCPIYKKPGEGFWRIDEAQVSSSYVEDLGWSYRIPWAGVSFDDHRPALIEGDTIKLSHGLSDAYLKIEVEKSAKKIGEYDTSCAIVKCNAEGTDDYIINLSDGHSGRMISILAVSETNRNCRVTGDAGEAYHIPSGIPTSVTSMTSWIKSTRSKTKCPPITMKTKDQMYGFSTAYIAGKGESDGPAEFFNNLSSIWRDFPLRKFTSIFLGVAIVYLTRFDKIGIIAAMVLYISMNVEHANALDPTIVEHLSLLDDISTVSTISGEFTTILLSLLTFSLIYSKLSDGGRIVTAITKSLILLSPMPLKMLMTLVHLSYKYNDRFRDAIDRYSFDLECTISLISTLMHPLMVTEKYLKEQSLNFFTSIDYEINKRVDQETNITVEQDSFSTPSISTKHYLSYPKRRLHYTKKASVKGLRDAILYEDEFEKLNHALRSIDPASLHRLYAYCPRIHSREVWHLRSIINKITNKKIKEFLETYSHD